MTDDEARGAPWWWPLVVGVALVLGALWLLKVVVGVIVGLVQIAILVVLAIALIGWALNHKLERGGSTRRRR
ncbi:MAG: hypothetical protein ABIV94_03005 [Acidimicrobiales bacterium]